MEKFPDDRFSLQIKFQGGKMKEIRKIIPLSEAKISLMISDLESRDIIKKVKKMKIFKGFYYHPVAKNPLFSRFLLP